jgi:hypothetical protein
MQKNLILSVADNYTYTDLARFFTSLSKTAYQGHVCVFIGPHNHVDLRPQLEKIGIELIPYRPIFPFLPHPHSQNFATLPDPIHIYNYRHFLYYDYLLHHGHRFNNVLLTDVKDVIFQQDPFAFPMQDALHVAMETQTIAECTWTQDWILAEYPSTVMTELASRQVTCAGTTLGPTGHVMRYLHTMLTTIATMNDAVNCADQAIQNVLLYQGALEPTVRLLNAAGILVTVGTIDPAICHYSKQGYLLTNQGHRVLTIHQADRHPSMLWQLDRFIFDRPWIMSKIKHWVSNSFFLQKAKSLLTALWS